MDYGNDPMEEKVCES